MRDLNTRLNFNGDTSAARIYIATKPFDCETCVKSDVCGRQDKYKKLKEEASKIIEEHKEFDVEIKCPSWLRKM